MLSEIRSFAYRVAARLAAPPRAIMGELRDRMHHDRVVRGLSERTRKSYTAAVFGLAKFYRRSPDRLTQREVEAYLVHLTEERKLAWNTRSLVTNGLRFFYHTTLGRKQMDFSIPRPKAPAKLPEILSREEVARILTRPKNPKHRVLLMTAYASGLRVSELVHLRVADLDSDRMTIRVEQGKGAQDRYTLLSPRLLEEMRAYWRTARPQLWLFPAQRRAEPISICSAQRVYERAKRVGAQARRHPRAAPRLRDPLARERNRSAHDPAAPGPPPPRHHDALFPPGPEDAGRAALAAGPLADAAELIAVCAPSTLDASTAGAKTGRPGLAAIVRDQRRGIPAPLPAPRRAHRLPAHPPLRPACQSPSRPETLALPGAPSHRGSCDPGAARDHH
jgi:site-specific recombinase XerD